LSSSKKQVYPKVKNTFIESKMQFGAETKTFSLLPNSNKVNKHYFGCDRCSGENNEIKVEFLLRFNLINSSHNLPNCFCYDQQSRGMRKKAKKKRIRFVKLYYFYFPFIWANLLLLFLGLCFITWGHWLT
jgi:hypothetical protein